MLCLFLLVDSHSGSVLIAATRAQIVLESQFRLGTSVYFTVPQAATKGPRPQEQSFALNLSPKLTPFRISETASPLPASWRPTDPQQAVLTGKRVVILDSSKFLVRGLCKLCEQVRAHKAPTQVRLLSILNRLFQMKMSIAYHNVEPHEPFIWLRTEATKVFLEHRLFLNLLTGELRRRDDGSLYVLAPVLH